MGIVKYFSIKLILNKIAVTIFSCLSIIVIKNFAIKLNSNRVI